MKNITLAAVIALAASAVTAEPMSFRQVASGGSCNSCIWTAAEGEITRDSPQLLRAYLAEQPYPGRIMFDSLGGNIGAAIRLGQIIREARLDTDVGKSRLFEDSTFEHEIQPGTCESACFFAFVGGLTRSLGMGKLGVHQFFTREYQNIGTVDTQMMMGQILLHLLAMEVDTEILSIASRTPPTSMHYLTPEELDALGLLRGKDLRGPTLIVRQGGLVAEWISLNGDLSPYRTVALRCSVANKAWVMTVRDHDPLIDSLPFDPAEPVTMRVATGGDMFDGDTRQLSAQHVLSAGKEANELFVSVRLPVDVRVTSGQRFVFEVTSASNFRAILSVDTTLPDDATLDSMVRACGD